MAFVSLFGEGKESFFESRVGSVRLLSIFDATLFNILSGDLIEGL